MRMSQLVTKTRKQAPADEVSRNAQLLIRAGYVHKEMAGVYGYLPLGIKVLERIKQIVREEMDTVGGQELIMTSLQRKETWEITDRWDDTKVDIWFKSHLQNGTEVGLGWSHEEPISMMMSNYISSYRDLPAYVYQFQTKLRNELRAKSGIMRGREFVMKDMYSYSRDSEQHEKFYQSVIDAYMRIFHRVGLGDLTFVTKASGGAFTQFSHEFQTLSEAGEDIVYQTSDGQWYNEEVAPAAVSDGMSRDEEFAEYEEVLGEGIVGVEDVAAHLGIDTRRCTKTLFYMTDDGRFVAAAIRADRQVNELKLSACLSTTAVRMARADEIVERTGCEIGYAGVVNLPEGIEVLYDDSMRGMVNFETGSNRSGYHSRNVNWGRDVTAPERFYDFKLAMSGDLDPTTGEPLRVSKAAEVGNIFNFGTGKCEQLGLYFADEDGVDKPVHLGSYGIGITRLMGVIVECFADDRGIVWPESVAPMPVHLVEIGKVSDNADYLVSQLALIGIEVLHDDRDARVGEKLADADLIGLPHRVVVSERLGEGMCEYKRRDSDVTEVIPVDELLNRLKPAN